MATGNFILLLDGHIYSGLIKLLGYALSTHDYHTENKLYTEYLFNSILIANPKWLIMNLILILNLFPLMCRNQYNLLINLLTGCFMCIPQLNYLPKY